MHSQQMCQLLKGQLLVLGCFFLVFLGMIFLLGAVMLGEESDKGIAELLSVIAGMFHELIESGQVGKGDVCALQQQQQRKHHGERTSHLLKIIK